MAATTGPGRRSLFPPTFPSRKCGATSLPKYKLLLPATCSCGSGGGKSEARNPERKRPFPSQ